jgi:hypothetical protein
MEKTFSYSLVGILLPRSESLYVPETEESPVYTRQHLIGSWSAIRGKYPDRSGKRQQSLSYHLQYQEDKMFRRLVARDSASYCQYTFRAATAKAWYRCPPATERFFATPTVDVAAIPLCMTLIKIIINPL